MEISDRQSYWSEGEIQAYLSGSMSADARQRFEEDLLDDPFLQEAVDGYRSSLGILNKADLTTRWESRTGKSSNGNSGGVAGPLILGAVGAALLMFSWSSYQQKQLSTKAENLKQSIELGYAEEQYYADSLDILEIELAQPIAQSKEISPQVTRNDQNELKDFAAVIEQRGPAPSPLELRGLDSTVQADDKKIEVPLPRVFYLHDLKLADYRPDYQGEFYLSAEVYTGTAALYESQNNRLNQMGEIKRLDYEEIMNEAMARFTSRDYKASLLILKRIESEHPNDVNAAFYGALCYYNLGKWDKADRRFRRAINHPRRVFDQEAEWYLALSLQEQGRLGQAVSILKGIVDKEGFYAEKARPLLRTLAN